MKAATLDRETVKDILRSGKTIATRSHYITKEGWSCGGGCCNDTFGWGGEDALESAADMVELFNDGNFDNLDIT